MCCNLSIVCITVEDVFSVHFVVFRGNSEFVKFTGCHLKTLLRVLLRYIF